jgi:glyoxylase-like metal-dependent hydrolase (beta-lactamase superfamily II)
MSWSRRKFITTSSLAVAGSSIRPPLFAQQQSPAAAPPVVPEFTAVRGNYGTFTARGGTIGWWVTPDAVVVIDSQFEDTAQMFLDGLRTRTQRKIDLLINTHHHRDHTTGNRILRPAVTKIVAHANEPALQRQQAIDAKTEALQVYPDETFASTWKVDMGTETISAKHYGPAHTGGDIAIFFERANVVHTGDLMSYIRHPRVDRPGGASIRNWIVALEQLVAGHDPDTIYVFGHAKVGLPVAGKRADLLALRDYFTALLGHVQKQIAAGRSVEETQKVLLPGFADWEGASTENLRVAYEELTSRS